MSTPTIDYAALARQAGAVSSTPANMDYTALAKQAGAIISQSRPSLLSNPKEYLGQRVNELQAESQRLNNLAMGPESEGKSLASRVGNRFLSLVPETAAVIDKGIGSLLDWKSAAAVGAGVVDPAIPAAYFMTQGAQGLKENAPAVIKGKASPNQVQDALLSASAIAGGAAGGASPKSGAVLDGAKNLTPTGLKAAVTDAYQARATSAARATIPEAANLPAKAVSGVEDIYRAAAPVGTNIKARGNLYAAAGDLAEIGRNAEAQISNAKGGVIQPDMRVRAAVDAANQHLQQMYETERAPQIARHDTNLIDAKVSADAKGGLEYLASNAGDSATRALAQKALESPDMTLADADLLARTVNKELLKFESMEPSAKATVQQTNAKINGLKDLDGELSQKINAELIRNGEEGLGLYERRYAAVSQVRDGLQRRMNAVELQRKIPGSGLIRAIRGGKEGIASASQAAVADVNIGKSIESGLRKLAETDLQPQRSQPRPTVRGLLKPAPTQLGSSLEPTTPASPVPPSKLRPHSSVPFRSSGARR